MRLPRDVTTKSASEPPPTPEPSLSPPEPPPTPASFLATNAPNDTNNASACCHATCGGASNHSTGPQQATCRRASVRSRVLISGELNAAACAYSASDMQRTTRPGASRPARPARWSMLDRAADNVTNPDIPRPASRRGTRANPLSTTVRTPGTVTEDSAIDVATITRPTAPSCPPGRSAASCSREDCRPCNGTTRGPLCCKLAAPPCPPARAPPFCSSASTSAHTDSTSRTPGANTRTECCGSAINSRAATFATCAQNSRRSPETRPGWGAYSTSTG